MTVAQLFYLLCFFAVFLFFWQGIAARERTLAYVKKQCQQQGLQLLDESVVLRGLWIEQGLLRRTYHFEFSSTGEERYQGEAVLLGKRFLSVRLPPYRLPESELSDE